MIELTPIIFIFVTLALVSILAGKIAIPYPILLILAGLLISFVPGLPHLHLDPEIVFILFLPPILFRAAWTTSWKDFKTSITPISRLAIGLVFLTTVSVAIVAHYLIPGMGWAVAFVLGAIVSPPDAVSATSILNGMGLPKKVVTILEGESLVNDASALIAYKYAIIAVVSSSFVFWQASYQFVLVSVGGTLIGIAMGYLFCFILKRIQNQPEVETMLTILVPFIVYPLAEEFETSGVLAVVCTGLVVSWRSPEIFSNRGRTLSNSVWEMLMFLFNGAVFLLIGFQLYNVVENTVEYKTADLIYYGLVISAVVIVARVLFMVPAMYFPSLMSSKNEEDKESYNWKIVLVLSWTGMRGVVSLATAMAIPLLLDNGQHFPFRKLILFVTFVVIVVTLVGQGLTLPYLIRSLKIEPVAQNSEEEEQQLRLLVANSALDFINYKFEENGMDPEVVNQVRKLYELRTGWIGDDKDSTEIERKTHLGFLHELVNAQLLVSHYKRELLVNLFKESKYTYENIKKIEREIDLDESRLRSYL